MTNRHKNLVLDASNKGNDERFYEEIHSICKQINAHITKHKNMNKLPAPLALKKHILKQVAEHYPDFKLPPLDTEDEIFDFYEAATFGDFSGHIQDTVQDIRCSGLETDLPAPHSRHYECEVHAIETDDGWIAYNYWHGGGKFGNEEEIDFISDSYYISCEEKEVLTIQRTWTKN